LWLLPLALSAFPALHDLQYGQFHLAAVSLSMGAMLAIETGRERLGGALLATAVLSKMFPGVLLLLLLAQRRFRSLGWAIAVASALTLLTLAVFGNAPLSAFVTYHLPRLQSGAAFAFGDAWPEMRSIVIAANHGVYGLFIKLAEMGVPGIDNTVAAWLNRVYAILLAAAALWVGLRATRLGLGFEVVEDVGVRAGEVPAQTGPVAGEVRLIPLVELGGGFALGTRFGRVELRFHDGLGQAGDPFVTSLFQIPARPGWLPRRTESFRHAWRISAAHHEG
jgi:hypothetical protein